MAEEKWVALCGSAPASSMAAPYMDPRWDIYGCSPGLYGIAKRVTQWFELHLWEPGQTWFSPEYVQWLTALPGRGIPLWTGDIVEALPGSQVIPVMEILEEFDPHRWFCTSSLFWMMAMAMRSGATKIGLWGIDMAANEEYEMQRAGIHHMAYIAQGRGIEVGVPHESDLFTPRFMYGVDEWTHSYRKTRARLAELKHRLADAEQTSTAKAQEAAFLRGAIDDLSYMTQTWVDKQTHTGVTAGPIQKVATPLSLPPIAEL